MELRKPKNSLTTVQTSRAYQLLAELDAKNKTQRATFVRSSNIIYTWIKDKFTSLRLPEQIRSYNREYADRFVGVIYDIDHLYFSMITKHADENIAGRVWITEVEIACVNCKLLVAIKNSYTTLTADVGTPIFSPPSFVYRLISQIGIVDIKQLERTPWKIDSITDVFTLFDIVSSKNRRLPVVVISQIDNNDYTMTLPDYLVDANKLQHELYSYAHIVLLPYEYTYKWTDLVEKSWSVYDGAIRIYFPMIDFDSCGYFNHPLWIKERILAAYKEVDNGKIITEGAAFIFTIIDLIKVRNNQERINWKENGIKTYYVANREIIEEKINTGLYNEEDAKIEINQLRQDLEDREEYVDLLEEETTSKDEEISRLREQVRGLKIYNGTLKYTIDNLKGYDSDNDIPIPYSYDQMVDWVDKYLAGRLILHNRAKRSIKEAEYLDIPHVYKALLLLATTYRNMKIGIVSQEEFEQASAQLSLSESISITETGAGMFGDTYFIKYKERKTFIGKHLCYNNSREPRYCLRIYFFWDDDDETVVVGSLPGHLENRHS